ncbi:DUF3185 family protein [Thalassospiraceae bacterium LMO-SO8]|nr:DUF3185 family protein [Alphaproteobacteria bacterium LMO-S08]WND76104.1 DUF3185 family protein [Thalassospiraceae bacterium LMO-SO8]
MNMTKAVGLAALAIGLVLLGFGFNAKDAPLDQLHNSLTGRYTDETMWYIVGGFLALVFGGIALFLRK